MPFYRSGKSDRQSTVAGGDRRWIGLASCQRRPDNNWAPLRAPFATIAAHRPFHRHGGRCHRRRHSLLFMVFMVAVVIWIAVPVQRDYQHQRTLNELAAIGAD